MVKYRTLNNTEQVENSRLREEYYNTTTQLMSAEAQVAQYEAMAENTDRPDEKQAFKSTMEGLKADAKRAKKRLAALKKATDAPDDLDVRVLQAVQSNLNSYERQHAANEPYLKFLKDSEEDEARVRNEENNLAGLTAVVEYYQAKLDELEPDKKSDEPSGS